MHVAVVVIFLFDVSLSLMSSCMDVMIVVIRSFLKCVDVHFSS